MLERCQCRELADFGLLQAFLYPSSSEHPLVRDVAFLLNKDEHWGRANKRFRNRCAVQTHRVLHSPLSFFNV